MPVEVAKLVDGFNKLWPRGTDPVSKADDHIRMIKEVLQLEFELLYNKTRVFSFEKGAVVNPDCILYYEAEKAFYQWNGAYGVNNEYVVNAGSTPETAGGVGGNAWTRSTGSGFMSTVLVSDTEPTAPFQNMLWWDTNSGTFFIYYNDGTSTQWVDLFGIADQASFNTLLFRSIIARLAAESGYILVGGSFQEGAVSSGSSNVVLDWNTAKFYQWHLNENKVVPAGSTPATSGGIGAGAWVDRTDVTLRGELASESGSGLVGYQPAGTGAVATTVQSKLREIVSVTDYYSGDTAAAFAAAFAAATTVVVPQGVTLTGLNTAVTIPSGKSLVLKGNVSGTSTGSFVMAGSGEFIGEGGLLTNVFLHLKGGSPRVRNFRYTGRNNTAAIMISDGAFERVLIDGLDIFTANFGVLRHGAGSTCNGAQVLNGSFYDLYGDAIEWNASTGDKNVMVDNHVIDLINPPAGFPNWGIGVGFAGSVYDNTFPDANAVKDFTISNIRGSRLRQLIHVESGKRFLISNIDGYDISDAYATSSGISHATVVAYGCTDFTVENIRSIAGTTGSGTAGMVAMEYGTISSSYIAPSQNYQLRNVYMNNGAVLLSTGNTGSTVVAENIFIEGADASFNVDERPGNLILRNIKAKRNKANGPALRLRLDLNIDGRQAFRSGFPSRLEIINCEGFDNDYASNCDVSGIVQQFIELRGNNFEAQANGAQGAAAVMREANRIFYGNSGGVPYGFEFVRGDMFFDTTAGVRYLFNTGGSINKGSDTFVVHDQAARLIRSTNYYWTEAFNHSAGQKITLSNVGASGTDLATSVVSVYISGGKYLIKVADTISAANGASGMITATNTPTYVTTV